MTAYTFCYCADNFNPLPPCGGRHVYRLTDEAWENISIHSLRVEGDAISSPIFASFPNFNPLPPCGGRQGILCAGASTYAFQSTPSVWRETFLTLCQRTRQSISIHSLRVEGDGCTRSAIRRTADFNPLPPCGGRPGADAPAALTMDFNPLPSCGGRLEMRCTLCGKEYISIHSLRVEGDAIIDRETFDAVQFQSTPSVWRETSMLQWVRVLRSISIHSLRVEGDTIRAN